MEDQIYYKVVTKNLKSAIIRPDNPHCIQYAINEWTRPKNPQAPLFVFETLDDVCGFIGHVPSGNARLTYDVYTCHIEKSQRQKVYGILNFWQLADKSMTYPHTSLKNCDDLGDSSAASVVDDFWSQSLSKLDEEYFDHVLSGTVFADAVKLLGKVA